MVLRAGIEPAHPGGYRIIRKKNQFGVTESLEFVPIKSSSSKINFSRISTLLSFSATISATISATEKQRGKPINRLNERKNRANF